MAKVVEFNRTGGSDVLEIHDVVVPAPANNEVQIRVKALGINRAEIMFRTGHYVIEPVFPARLGYEAAGTVEKLGEGVTGLAIGDKVSVVPSFSFANYGLYGEVVNAPAHAVVKHPETLSFDEAAATWMMFVTAYGALIHLAQMQTGDVVLIRAASSSTGVAAIQMANLVGAIPIALTRTSGKRQALLDAGAAHVIATEEEDLVTSVQRITGGRGARIAFDPVGGPEVPKILKSLGTNGIFFQYGALDEGSLEVPVMDLLGMHLTIRGYELFEITLVPERLKKAIEFIRNGLAKGALRPIIAKTFPFEKIREAHDYMESNAQIGKIVVQLA